MSNIEKVLVTGATGFLGNQVVDTLLDDGYSVRGTARSKSAPRLIEAYKLFGDRFEVAVVDDVATSDLSEALKAVDAVIHVASPMVGTTDAATVLKSAIDGTTHVLEAASTAGVSKVVITSSIAALVGFAEIATSVVIGENSHNPATYEQATRPGIGAFEVYAASKGLADKATWEYAREHPELDIVTIHPPAIYGPSGRGQVIGTPANSTNSSVYALIDGPRGRPVPATTVVATYIHVKDAARAHVNALKLAKSDKPKRIIPNAGEYNWVRAVRHLEKVRPELKDRLPVIEGDGPEVPAHATFDNSSARQVGLVEYISFEQTVEEALDDVLRREKALGITPA